MISGTARISNQVELGEGCEIEDFVIIGAPYKGQAAGSVTRIGLDARIRSFTVIYAGNTIGSNFQTGNKANIRELNVIGDDVSIGTLSVVEHHVEIGDGTRVHTQAFIPEFTVIGKGCWIGPNVVLTNAKYPNTPRTKDRLCGVVVGDGARIGANSTGLPGIKIGAGCLIGAGSVVTWDTVMQGVYFGNPARLAGWVCECGIGLEGKSYRLECPDCGRTFTVSGERISPIRRQ